MQTKISNYRLLFSWLKEAHLYIFIQCNFSRQRWNRWRDQICFVCVYKYLHLSDCCYLLKVAECFYCEKRKEQSQWDVWWSEVSLHLRQSLQSFISFLTVRSSTYHPISGAESCLPHCVYDEDEQINVFSERFNKRLTERCCCFNKDLGCFLFSPLLTGKRLFSDTKSWLKKILTWWWMSGHVAPSAG